MRYLIFFCILLSAASCAPRIYWPQGHSHRAAVPPAAPAVITVLEEGRDYQGWTPTRPTCQQQPFPFHLSKQ